MAKTPARARKAAKRAKTNTLQIIADEFVEKRMMKATPPLALRTIQKARSQLREFIYPQLGQRPIHEITISEVRKALQAILVNGQRIETAYKTKELLGRVFRYANSNGKAYNRASFLPQRAKVMQHGLITWTNTHGGNFMNKLKVQKKWLTIPDAAKHLSGVL